MKQFSIAVCLLMAFMLFSESSLAQKSVWKSNDIHRMEVHSLYDLIAVTSGWTMATNDDATVQYTRNGLSGIGGSYWPIYLNGTQLHIQNWNTISFHAIPVTPANIDSVVIMNDPVLFGGEFNERGGIYIYTKNPDDGIQLNGNALMGNRSGDPGPFVYTDSASRNIERLGPVADASLSYRKNSSYVQAGVKQFVHAVTDPIQFRRLTPFEFGEGPYRHEKIRSNSAFVNSEIRTGIFRHQFQAGITEADDFLFTALYGTEIPVHRKWYFVSATGEAELHQKLYFKYSINRNSDDLKEYPNKENRWLRWKQTVNTAKASLQHSFRGGNQSTSLIMTHYTLDDETRANAELQNQILKLSHRLEYNFAEKVNMHSNLQAVHGEELALKGSGNLQFQVHQHHRLQLHAAYAERLPEEDNSLWYWIFKKSYGQNPFADLNHWNLPEKSILKRAGLSWRAEYEKMDFTISAILTKLQDEYLLDYKLTPLGQRIESGFVELVNDVNASFFRLPVNAEVRLSPKIVFTMKYSWSKHLGEKSEYFEMIPENRIMMNVNWLPAESFKIWGRFQAQSSSYWQETEGIDGHEVRINPLQKDYYFAVSESRFQMDLGIRKSFWKQKISFSLDMENINNSVYRNHPVSPQHAFSVYLGMHFGL